MAAFAAAGAAAAVDLAGTVYFAVSDVVAGVVGVA